MRRLGFDASDQLGASAAMKLWRQVAPAGQGREFERFYSAELHSRCCSPASPHPVLSRPIEPGATDGPSRQQGLGRARAGPIGRMSDEVLFAAVSQNVKQALDLRGRLVRDQNRLIAPAPELLPPLHLATDLAGEVRVEVVHEGGQPIRARDGEQQVEVVGEEAEGMDLDGVQAHRSGEHSADEVRDQRRGRQQESPLNGAARHLDQGTGRYETESSAHAKEKTESPPLHLALPGGWHLVKGAKVAGTGVRAGPAARVPRLISFTATPPRAFFGACFGTSRRSAEVCPAPRDVSGRGRSEGVRRESPER